MNQVGYKIMEFSQKEKRVIFDFNENIYGEKIKIEFVQMIRKEKTFANLEALKQQLIEDENKCRTVLHAFTANSKKF